MYLTPQLKKELIKKIQSRPAHFDYLPINILEGLLIDQGLMIFYYVKNPFTLGAVLFDSIRLKLELWRTANPVWQTDEKIKPIKIIRENNDIYFSYTLKKSINTIKITTKNIFENTKLLPKISLERLQKNPILEANQKNSWEASAVFNAGAIYLENRVHFVYRAIMSTGESVFGYASSKDGIHIDERSDRPIYACQPIYNKYSASNSSYSYPFIFGSGGSWAGCEDPRLCCIDDTIYMTYTVYNAFQPQYIEITSISIPDFLNREWRWKSPKRISPLNEMHKNWVIFPEKINGKFAILHSLTPRILIDYVDSLDQDFFIRSHYKVEEMSPYWDNWVRGSGPPPIKTEEGWLILYHAMDKKDPNKYKIGAMLLDEKDPSKVKYRSTHPILEPEARYEIEGFKSGVVYTCGTALIDDLLYVYYGAADSALCGAYIKLSKLIEGIKNSQHSEFIKICKVN